MKKSLVHGFCVFGGLVLAAGVAFTVGAPRVAWAGDWDLNLARLCQLKTNSGALLDCGKAHDFAVSGGLVNVDPIVPDNESFRSLMSELGVIFAPGIAAPAETVGFGGFDFSFDYSMTSINRKRSANPDIPESRQRYWRAAESVSDKALAVDDIRDGEAANQIDRELPPALAHTIAVMVRKGFWFPVPSMELAAGVKHLLDSKMFAGVFSAKLALHEGFQHMPIPAFAVRGSVSRLFGTPGFDLTIGALDFSASKAFGVASTIALTVYGGYQLLWIIADSGVLDATPAEPSIDLSNQRHFTFLDQSDILRHRVFAGVRASFFIGALLLELSYFTKGLDSDEVPIPSQEVVKVDDRAGPQFSGTISIALDF